MFDTPLVSVVMPAYNAAVYIGHALNSALSQTYRNIEVIVVDDGSDDETARIVETIAKCDGRVRLLQQSNLGVARARNLAIEVSSGAFIAPIDADDIWFPLKIEKQVRCMLESGPSVGLVYTWWKIIDHEGIVSVDSHKPSVEGNVFETLIRSNFIGNASVPLMRRTCLEEVGGYNCRMLEQGGQGCEDWDLSLRLAECYEFRVVRECLVGYRKVDNSMSSLGKAMATSHAIMLEDIKQRHPEIPSDFYRLSQSGFYRYLSRTSYIDGNHWAALHWVAEAWRVDHSSIWHWRTLFILVTSVPLALARPVVRRIWPKRHTWLRLRRARVDIQRRFQADTSGKRVLESLSLDRVAYTSDNESI